MFIKVQCYRNVKCMIRRNELCAGTGTKYSLTVRLLSENVYEGSLPSEELRQNIKALQLTGNPFHVGVLPRY